jgi:hypothetical protein
VSGFTFRLRKSGRFATDGVLKGKADRVMAPYVKRAGHTMQEAIKSVTPVDTGYLRRTTTASLPDWRGEVLRVKLKIEAPYAKYVNRRGRSAGYIERGIARGKPNAMQILRDGARALSHDLWVPS